MSAPASDDPLLIGARRFHSRLLTGTGKFKDLEETRLASAAAGSEIVTFAVRRMNLGQDPTQPSLLDALPLDRYTLLPGTHATPALLTAPAADIERLVRTGVLRWQAAD